MENETESSKPRQRPQTLIRAGGDSDEYWIVSSYRFFQHGTLKSAQEASEHLKQQFPKGSFTIHRVRRDVRDWQTRLAEQPAPQNEPAPPASPEPERPSAAPLEA